MLIYVLSPATSVNLFSIDFLRAISFQRRERKDKPLHFSDMKQSPSVKQFNSGRKKKPVLNSSACNRKETGSCCCIRCTLWVLLIWPIPSRVYMEEVRNSVKAGLYVRRPLQCLQGAIVQGVIKRRAETQRQLECLSSNCVPNEALNRDDVSVG